MARERETQDVASFGFDDFLQIVGGDPALGSSAVGLRVPALAGVRYLFLGARADLDEGDSIVGYAQLATLGFARSGTEDPAAAPLQPFEQAIEAPWWHPTDGFISWHLTFEPLTQGNDARSDLLDQDSFRFEDSSTPALLFETAHFPASPAAPGYLGLDAYAPPAMRGVSQLTLRDVRAPWHKPCPMRITIDRPTCVRFYIDVLQTDPSTRFDVAIPPTDFVITGLTREDNFLQLFTDAQYWRVGVRLLIERAARKRG